MHVCMDIFTGRYTPIILMNAIRGFLKPSAGTFLLDAASSRKANITVRADEYFSLEEGRSALDDERMWCADSAYLNPPSRKDLPSLCSQFVTKFVQQFEAGFFKEGLLLVRSGATTTKWFATLAVYPHIPLKSLEFINGNDGTSPTKSSRTKDPCGRLLFYFGKRVTHRHFEKHFEAFINK